MSHGMVDYERSRSRDGLADVAEYERYCYFVAGVVGEMLTELFCDYSPEIDARRDDLEARAVSFGLGLQMTNILKDIWDDLRSRCLLAALETSSKRTATISKSSNRTTTGTARPSPHRCRISSASLTSHLREALDYTLAIPSNETGIRRFLIWAVLLAVSTLGKISANPLFTIGSSRLRYRVEGSPPSWPCPTRSFAAIADSQLCSTPLPRACPAATATDRRLSQERT